MGSLFAVRVTRAGDLEALPGVKVALVAGAGFPLAELWRIRSERATESGKVRAEATLLIGSERDGLPDAVLEEADHTAHIPIRSHSLNAAMAATVALYELTRMARP